MRARVKTGLGATADRLLDAGPRSGLSHDCRSAANPEGPDTVWSRLSQLNYDRRQVAECCWPAIHGERLLTVPSEAFARDDIERTTRAIGETK